MKTENAPSILRSGYVPLAWRIDHLDLHFNLDPVATIVKSRLRCVRNALAPAAPLRLFGEDIELLDLTVNGAQPAPGAMTQTADGIEIALAGESAEIEIVTRVNPSANTTLSGLYLSRGGFFTQCEAEGFRRISFFPDRPDAMARFTVTLEADAATCPVLLSNGNLIEQGPLDGGRHYARWEDPFPKPSYLFALVAANLVSIERRVNTASGREVLLQVWVEDGNLDRSAHAMDSLIHSMRWDEETFGLELDLDRFMIVAVSDFNMGAMENKGLNIFNSKYVLAKPDTATDVDYENIESVVAHEYFHNWTGNRVTCRDWFQLTLKEGLTVFRDQQFSADMLGRMAEAGGEAAAASARAVKRIDDVRVLRTAQFAEDAGPMAHPIRPDSYQEINNFYTATVYEKGAEVIRMLHTLLGAEGFRNGMDLYFSYHDGQAVTCDDFVDCMAEANGRDLDQFMRWYGQAGTPRVTAQGRYDAESRSYTLTLTQHTPPTPDQPDKLPLVIPVAVGLIGPDGADLPLRLQTDNHGATTKLIELTEAEQSFQFTDLDFEPVPSLLRGFSAPVILDLDEDDARLAFRMAHDSDAFNRWDAAQRYAERVVLALAADAAAARPLAVPAAFVRAFRALLTNDALDPAFRAQAAALPAEAYLLERMAVADPAPLRAALMALMRELGGVFAEEWLTLYRKHEVTGPYRYHPADAGRRALRNLALKYLAAAGVGEGLERAHAQFERFDNMTEGFGALAALVHSANPAREAALDAFHRRYRDDALVLDKWFALQAGAWRWDAETASVLERVRRLMDDPGFSIENPNKVYALLGSFFRANPAEFHAPDGDGYVFWADQVLALDQRNPQVASRVARALESWRRFTPEIRDRVGVQLERVRSVTGLSPDVAEIIDKALQDGR
ncbi:aminopeptidase N [Aromatoleum bremense]|uniref:Aminopeptidase N n=1 Tax=Aromatoleum bremense TaxID=76115 RepID=A0ABX1NU05_9RHOO|nr:aminopeptidase N [Aromatoleum bremense]NMG15243.1 aminopeptidase N [Aromatoleum bremense]QTQ33355.1 Aminopeptidase N [Aromatoleum bremense]